MLLSHWRIDQFGASLSEEQKSNLKIYHEELLKFNKQLNLVSPATIESADLIHFSDSVLAAQCLEQALPENKTVYDIGSGSGFPGVVFSAIFNKTNFICLDSDLRKMEFIKNCAYKMRRNNLSVCVSRVESLDQSIEFGISRAFAPLDRAIDLLDPVTMPGAKIYFLKGPKWESEAQQIDKQYCSTWNISLFSSYVLPGGETKYLVLAEKN